MAKYFISGIYSKTREYSFKSEIDADSPEEAAAKFKEEASVESTWNEIIDVEVEPPFTISGSFSVYENKDDMAEWENALIEVEGFEGYK